MTLKEFLEEIKNEEYKSGKIYESMAQGLDGTLREVAQIFSEEEMVHMDLIRKTIELIDNPTQQLPKEIVQEKKEINKMKTINLDNFSEITRKELFKYALEIEKMSISLYELLISYFNDEPKIQSIFDNLVAEERNHMYFILRQLHQQN